MITKPGAYRITEEDYHADNLCETPSLSRSTIKELVGSCPKKAWINHPRLNPNFKPKHRDIFDLGHVSHGLLLEGIDKMEVIKAENWKTNAAKEARDEARKHGKVPILIEHASRVKEMVCAADEQLASSELGIKNLREEGDSELSYIWQEHDVWMRVRPDWIRKDRKLILDYKSTGTVASPEEYSRIVASTGLDIQNAFYPRGVHNVERSFPDMVFMVQETSEPYLCSFITLDSMFKEMGEQKVTKGIRLWAWSLKYNTWPGYSTKIQTVEPKPYHLASRETKMQEAV